MFVGGIWEIKRNISTIYIINCIICIHPCDPTTSSSIPHMYENTHIITYYFFEKLEQRKIYSNTVGNWI